MTYVHGYDTQETTRLQDQADALVHLLHHDTSYPPAGKLVEVGCGVGAQTLTLARRNPEARIVAMDRSATSITTAEHRIRSAGLHNVAFHVADLFDSPFPEQTFDHAFVCFVLEHLDQPVAALRDISRMLKPGGTITVVEGDHGSAYFHPVSHNATAAIGCLVELQRRAGGDALIGRRLFPLLVDAGFEAPEVSPRNVYVDGNRPALADAFIRKTFTAMVAGVRADAVDAGLITAGSFDAGLRDLQRTAEPDGTFSYTFFKALAHKPQEV